VQYILQWQEEWNKKMKCPYCHEEIKLDMFYKNKPIHLCEKAVGTILAKEVVPGGLIEITPVK